MKTISINNYINSTQEVLREIIFHRAHVIFGDAVWRVLLRKGRSEPRAVEQKNEP